MEDKGKLLKKAAERIQAKHSYWFRGRASQWDKSEPDTIHAHYGLFAINKNQMELIFPVGSDLPEPIKEELSTAFKQLYL